VYLEPEGGWRPPWEQGVIAAVVLGSGLLAAMVGIIAASWAQQKRLLGNVMVRGSAGCGLGAGREGGVGLVRG
jgi:hypothetical protein